MARHSKESRQTSRHHVFFERPNYERERPYREVRSFGGFIIMVANRDHNNGPRALHSDPSLRRGVPRPARDSLEYFLSDVLEPFQIGKSRDYYLNQAIGWFGASGDLPTAEHLLAQHAYIMRTPILGEGVQDGCAA